MNLAGKSVLLCSRRICNPPETSAGLQIQREHYAQVDS
jgi:hypothetical protein